MKKNVVKLLFVLSMTLTLLLGCSNLSSTEKSSNEEIMSVTEDTLKEIVTGKDYVIVDTRNDEEYNGWVIDKDITQGHIKGAVNFSESWLENLSDKDKQKLLDETGITKDKKIIIYSNYGKESLSLAEKMSKLGYEEVLNISLKDISSDSKLSSIVEFEHMENYQMFVYPQWVKDLVAGNNPDTYDGRDYIIIDTNYKTFEDYKKGHLPTSIYMDTCEIEEAPLWNLVSPEKFKELFKKTGITKDTLVILSSDEPMASGRLAAAFMYAGVEDVRMLNGGNQAWRQAGFEMETKVNEWKQGDDFGAKIPVHPEYNIGMEEAKKLLNNPNGRLVAVVCWDEYTGKNNGGYSYFDEKGRIPGSVFGYGGVDAYHSEDFLDSDWTMRSYKEMEKIWAEWDIKPENESSFFCATGWRGGLAFFETYAMGWKNVSVFDGGFYEWSRDPKNPINTGDPREEYKKDRENSELKYLNSVGNH
ncbi:MAG: rhodanese-like domain-containing protein [Tepidibacter sp.]|uniref:rhodanese-like domain-containing protein n=1 Tax=Tepidibacter sp. TaxID=2529387 RepID=UPI002600C68E|nr:rhodanese-like domain-containing protein [Tepidibacter sp.]MCT4507764.1 rhodanese-like domain-containing protein [Tepidibacter sp.]